VSKENILIKPDIEVAKNFIKKALSSNSVIVIIGDCSVNYLGRASSKISWGERIIIIKEDCAVLVHRPFGYEPINWQPSGSYIESIAKENQLILKIIRRKPSEKLNIHFRKIYLVISYKLKDDAIFYMYGEEEDLKRAIIANPDIIEEGLKILETERKTGNGYIDILARDSNNILTVVELKKITASEEAVRQLNYYVNSLRSEIGKDVRGILVAPKFTKRALMLLKKYNLEYKKVNLRKISKITLKKNDITRFFK